ncbi:MAG TPA: hypothetical protein VFQ61_31280 [Polyangiaceae bacterium]|nr:hypothetical protein [Polyangiaceae bacterium]
MRSTDESPYSSPELVRRQLGSGRADPTAFRAALRSIPEAERDAWVDLVLELGDLPADSPELPRGCVPYLPCSVNTLLRMIELADVRCDDVFVDIGCGIGRATAVTHLLTGATAIGLEIQSALAGAARELAWRLNAPRLTVVEGDAAKLACELASGSVFFLYCPFSGERLDRVIDDIGSAAKSREVRVCSVDLPIPARPWLTPVSVSGDLAVYRSASL